MLLTLVFVGPLLYFKSQFKYFVCVCVCVCVVCAVALFSSYVVHVTKSFKRLEFVSFTFLHMGSCLSLFVSPFLQFRFKVEYYVYG